MSGLRGRLKRLEKDAEGGRTVIECPTCGKAFMQITVFVFRRRPLPRNPVNRGAEGLLLLRYLQPLYSCIKDILL